MDSIDTYTAFDGNKLLFQGPLSDIVLKIKKRLGKAENSSILIFSDSTGKTMDFNFQGNERDVQRRLEVYVTEEVPKDNSGPGRPKLGVISREVSLLPRHWEWLATQSGGASSTLRTLVEEAKKKLTNGNQIKQAQERTYKFISAIAGDFEGYEEALRALYKRDENNFLIQIQGWPNDVKNHAIEMATPAFDKV
ncbi:MAG: DUF2239 family protein [Bacteriovorax sp.]|nr:DUF2239 family protein [Bacteriovorax sp.]